MSSWYSNHIYPRLMDVILGGEIELRREALKNARGCVLEVGFGTGLNLSCYPQTIDKLFTLDVAEMLPDRVQKRISEVSFDVQPSITKETDGFPFPDRSFDSVVTTWTLCSVGELGDFLQEIRRVLKADGHYLFLEHGRAANGRDAARQRRFNWASKWLANGCVLDRRIPTLIEESEFRIVEMKQFVSGNTISVAGHMFQGIAKST